MHGRCPPGKLWEDLQLSDANPYYGYVTLDDTSYLVRKRSPHKKRIDLTKSTQFKDFRRYAKACGMALAYSHLRSDWKLGSDAMQRVRRSIEPDTFAVDIGHFAMQMAVRVTEDWRSFKRAFEAGGFRF